MITTRDLNFFIVSFSLSLIILYFFLRFQFGFNTEALAAILIVYLFTASYSTLHGIANFHHSVGSLDALIKIFFFYTLMLVFKTISLGGFTALLYSLKDYVFPILFGYMVSRALDRDQHITLLIFISFLCFIAGLIYIYEIYIYSNNGEYMNYMKGLRNLYEVTHENSGNMQTVISGNLSNYTRLPGLLAMTNVTGVLLAIGVILSYTILNLGYKFLGSIFLIICLIATVLAMSRIAIFALFSGFLFYFYHTNRLLSFAKYLFLVLFALMLIYIFNSTFFSGAVSLNSPERILNTFLVVFSLLGENLEIGRVYNLIIGSGFTFYEYNKLSSIFGPILTEDLFIVYLVTAYGLFPLAFFFISMFYISNKILNSLKLNGPHKDYLLVLGMFSSVIVFGMSTIHTNALVRPQLFPLFFVFLFLISRYENYYGASKLTK